MNIGNRIKTLLAEKNMTQKMLAEQLNQSPVVITNMLKKKTLDTGKLEKIAKILNVPIIYFFEEDNNTDREHRELVGILEKQIKLLEEIAIAVKKH